VLARILHFAGDPKLQKTFVNVVNSFKIDRVNVPDDFEVIEP